MTASRRHFVAATISSCLLAHTQLTACASDERASHVEPEAAQAEAPAEDAAFGDAEAGSCADCAYFPAECAPDVLCPNGPFDPTSSTAGMDWRTQINFVRGRSESDVWIAGAVGAVAHFDGTSWTPSNLGTQESQRFLWLPESAEVSLGSMRGIYTRGLDHGGADASVSPDGWSHREGPPGPYSGAEITAAWSPPGSPSLWAATNQPFTRGGSDLWRLHLTGASTFEALPGIAASDCPVPPCRRVRCLHGASEKVVWAVGDVGSAMRIDDADGDAPTATAFNTLTWAALSGVWAAAESNAWAVGGAGTIRHYAGDPLRWDIVSNVPTNENLNAVWGTSASDIWAAGDAGVVLHFDGTSWSRVKIAGLGSRRPDLFAVWSPGPGHVWVGGKGILLSLGGKP